MTKTVELSRWPKAVLVVAAAMIALTAAVQTAAMTLVSAPANTVSRQYGTELNWWVQPWLDQNWKLFGPKPQTANDTILARVRTPRGGQSAWIDLTAIDYAAIRHDPMPSHANENELRLAFSAYASSAPDSAQQDLLRQYLMNFACQRLGISVPGRYSAIQLQLVTTPMGAPGGVSVSQAPTNQYLPWWPLTESDTAT